MTAVLTLAPPYQGHFGQGKYCSILILCDLGYVYLLSNRVGFRGLR